MDEKLIEVRKPAAGKSAFIKGTRVRVSDIARMCSLGESADEIRNALPHLSAHQIQAAIDYWRGHATKIEAEINEEDRLLARMKS
jgi:uncharacterized protein (DUF433 family)